MEGPEEGRTTPAGGGRGKRLALWASALLGNKRSKAEAKELEPAQCAKLLSQYSQQGGPWELEATGKAGSVVVNGTQIIQGTKVPLSGGDEVFFGRSGLHCYIFQHPLTGPNILASGQNILRGPFAISIASRENNQEIESFALGNQSNFRSPNPSATLSPSGCQAFKDGLKQRILSPKDIHVTLDNFPYYLSHSTKEILLLSAFVHMDKEFNKCSQKVSSLNQRILLSGPSGSELYQETLVKALAKHFDARFLILDSLVLCGMSSKLQESLKDVRSDGASTSSSGADILGTSRKNIFREGDRVYIGDGSFKSTPSSYVYRGKVALAFEKNGSSKVGVIFDDPIEGGNDLGGLCDPNRGFFCHAAELQLDSCGGEVDSLSLEKFIEEDTASKPEGSRSATESTKHLHILFPNQISIDLPQNGAQILNLKKQLEQDAETLKDKVNINNIRMFLTNREIECICLEELSINDRLLTNEDVDKIVGYAISHYLQNFGRPKCAKMELPIESLKYGLSVVQRTHSEKKSPKHVLKDVLTENVFEENIFLNVISPNNPGVIFADIGVLDDVKATLKKLVMLPLHRPELFNEGQLRKPVKGILLFGPPGTGKTMLAKAVASEAGANIINLSISSITSKWLRKAEKYVKAVFSLASKLSPAIIFFDEVDSFLGNIERLGEHEAMSEFKNEFLINWDGLHTKEKEYVTVLGATNRPFDLDDAVIRRFPCRLMVSVPDASSREKILKVILSKEMLAPDVDLKLVASMASGYLWTNLKNLCVTAAFRPLDEIMEKERKEKSLAIAEGRPEPPLYGTKDIRPLGMDDFKFALGQVHASFSPNSSTMDEFIEWNNKFGVGLSKLKQTMSYFI